MDVFFLSVVCTGAHFVINYHVNYSLHCCSGTFIITHQRTTKQLFIVLELVEKANFNLS